MKRVFAYIVSWIALALCFGSLVGAQHIPRLRALASQGIETQGVVLALEPSHHQTVRYSYRVGGVRYSAHTPSSRIELHLAGLRQSEPPNRKKT